MQAICNFYFRLFILFINKTFQNQWYECTQTWTDEFHVRAPSVLKEEKLERSAKIAKMKKETKKASEQQKAKNQVRLY